MAQNQNDVIINIDIRYEDAFKKIADSTLKIKELLQVQKDLEAQQKKLDTSTQEGRRLNEEYTKSIAINKAIIDDNKKAIQTLNKEVQNNIKIEKEHDGSINSMRATLSNLKAEYDALSKADRKNVAIGGEMLKQTAALNAELKEAEQAYGDFSRDVGNYEKATKNLRTEIREVTQQLAQMKLAGEGNSVAYQELAAKAGNLRDAMDDVNQEIRARASDTYMFDTIMEGVQGVVAAYGVWKSATAALGIENENVDKTVQQLITVTTALNSSKTIQNALQKQSNIYRAAENLLTKIGINQTVSAAKAEVAYNVVKGKGSIATKAAAAATWLWNAALAANPVVLIAAAVAGLIAGVVALTKVFSASANAQKEAAIVAKRYETVQRQVAEAIKGVDNAEKNATARRNSDLKKELLELERNGASAVEIERAKAKAAEDVRQIQRLASEEKSMLTARDIAATMESIKAEEKVLNTFEKGSEKYDEQKKKVDDLKENLASLNQTSKELAQLRIDIKIDSDAASQALSDFEKEAAKKAAEIALKAATERRQKELEAIRAAQDAANELIANNQERELKILQTGSERQIAELQKRLDTEKNLSMAAREAIASQITSITEKTAQEVAAINKKYSDAELAKAVADEQAKIELRLLKAKEGSDEEFAARKMQLEHQMQQELVATELTESQKALIREKYGQQINDNENERLQAQADLRALAMQNELNLQLQKLGENETAKAQLMLQHEQQLNEQLLALDAEAKAKQYSSNEAYEAAVIASKGRVIDAEKAVQDASLANAQQTIDSIATIGGAMEELFTSLGEDNEAMAEFTKAIALFNIGINTAKSISAAIAGATEAAAATGPAAPFTLAAYIASMIAAVAGAITQARQVLNKEKKPKAPKFAQGGVITGAGSGTSDSIPINASNGESMMTALATQMFSPILSPLNQIGGGVPIVGLPSTNIGLPSVYYRDMSSVCRPTASQW
ncbi:MAG: hypothetical protein LBV41_04770 [Cytophagaceae bacterium]|jgi:hypothetical protein|nr:hypothetical protein [Cytophagaceae bacterium]